MSSQLPANVRKLKANAGTVRSETGPKAPVNRPVPPADMSPEELAYWDRAVADLEPIGLLARSDASQLRSWCQAAVIRDRAWVALEEGGVVVNEGRGPVKNPAYQVWRDSASLMDRLGKPLGLSPEARLRMPRVDVVLDDDELD